MTPVAVVLSPDLFAASFFDPNCRKVIMLWRDGAIIPLVNRELLVVYLRILNKFGLPPHQMKVWTKWFTSAAHAEYFQDVATQDASWDSLCETLASRRAGSRIVCWRKPNDSGQCRANPWITANEFLQATGNTV
jgi:hypothetical protein